VDGTLFQKLTRAGTDRKKNIIYIKMAADKMLVIMAILRHSNIKKYNNNKIIDKKYTITADATEIMYL
jgi:hypothetical protein